MVISAGRMGACAVIDEHGVLEGIITDGDLRRMMEQGKYNNFVTAKEIMSKNPRYISSDEMAVNAFYIMEQNKITQLAVVDNNKFIGMIHLHDILREGIV